MTDYKPNPDLDLVLERTVPVPPEKVTPFGTLERRIRLKSPPSGPALAIK